MANAQQLEVYTNLLYKKKLRSFHMKPFLSMLQLPRPTILFTFWARLRRAALRKSLLQRRTEPTGSNCIFTKIGSLYLQVRVSSELRIWLMSTYFFFPIRQATIDLIRRAEKANFKALVVTVDTAVLGRRLVNEKHGFDLPAHLKYPQYYSVWLST